MKAYEILMGACGWEHQAWEDRYYPPDLPPEWRLAYYGNEFPVVLIPHDYWQGGYENIDAWIEETEDRPLFIAEMPLREDLQKQGCGPGEWFEQLTPLGHRLLGVCLRAQASSDLAASIAAVPREIPLCLPTGVGAEAGEFEAIAARAGRDIGCCWDGQGAPDCLHQGAVAIARVDSNRVEARELRGIVEALRSAISTERTVVLIADGDPPNLETLRNAEVIAQLL